MTNVAAELESVRGRIVAAALRHGRDPAGIRLVAVSKRKSAGMVRAAYDAGQRDFGENYVQEMQAKAAELSDLPDIRWHMIGHLQRNKVKHVVPIASAIHTLDSARLASELGRRAAAPVAEARAFPVGGATDGRLVVLVEVNVSGESQKSGCTPEALGEVLDAVDAEEGLRLSGLMTVPPFTEDPAESEPYFGALAKLRDTLGGPARLPELSMGMTRDLEFAIAAGATIVRVGTAVFGAREK